MCGVAVMVVVVIEFPQRLKMSVRCAGAARGRQRG